MSDGPIIAFDISILLRLSRLDVAQGDVAFLCPFHQLAADVFGPVVDPYCHRLTAPFDDLVQAANDALGRKREIYLDAQPLAVEVVQNVQQVQLPTILKTIRHEVHRPDQVRLLRYGQSIRLLAPQPLAWLDPEVQFQLTIDAVYPLWFQRCPGHYAGRENKGRSPSSSLPRQPDQEIGDLLVLTVQLGVVTIAGLVDTKGAAGECNAHPAQRHRFPGHISRR